MNQSIRQKEYVEDMAVDLGSVRMKEQHEDYIFDEYLDRMYE